MIQIRYFASIRESLGASESVDFGAGGTIADLREQLLSSSPRHAAALARGKALRCALNQTMCAESAQLAEGDEVAFFPPVTGG
ncbi:MAG: MoaD/ThiS family protein [Ideonella sp.]